MDSPHATDTFDQIVGSLRPGSEILEQLQTLRHIRRELQAENAELRQLLVEQQTVIDQYARLLHR